MIDLSQVSDLHVNPTVDELIAACLESDGCVKSDSGAVGAYSGAYRGRTPKNKFTVKDDLTRDAIWWENNHAMEPEHFARLRDKLAGYAKERRLYVIDTIAGADPAYQIRVRFIVERPYHALFIRQLLIRPSAEQLADFQPDWVGLNAGVLELSEDDGTHGNAVVAMNFTDRQILIAGTQYAGEMKKSVFSLMNFLLPRQGVLSMHCSANIGPDGASALFFGLSGTGKTTLSADPERQLIGDDEHGWSDQGVFNIEGGCYAKCINLSAEKEPEIFGAIRHGALLENVVFDADGHPDYADKSLTENTRCAYPIDHIANAVHPSVGGHPKDIVFLTCDALGVLPPISRLTPEQAMEHFLNGYTSKLAGTEVGVSEPELTFSTCFGQPFLPLHPSVYATLLAEKIRRHGANVWLVNTGWTGGSYGAGERISLKYTRAMLHAAFDGQLNDVSYVIDPIFGLSVPTECPGVPAELLQPRLTWSDSARYDETARRLKGLFDENASRYAGIELGA
jgi:phosphoenolpyruvate carboxykinase (ATP)